MTIKNEVFAILDLTTRVVVLTVEDNFALVTDSDGAEAWVSVSRLDDVSSSELDSLATVEI